MKQESKKNPSPRVHLLTVLSLAAALLSSTVAARTLASQALAEGVADGTLNQVRQELLMDLAQKQKYEYDEAGIEELGRNLGDQGKPRQALEILQLNQMIFSDSPRAANALGDAYLASGQEIPARIYYDMALRMDPENEHAQKATAGQQEMQAALAQAGVEMTPEQMEKMQQAQAQLEANQSDPAAVEARERQQAETRQRKRERQSTTGAAEPDYESEFCMILHEYNSEKKTADPELRARFEGNYPVPGVKMKSWNVETACNDFLVAVPLWADVSPPILRVTSSNAFEDVMGGTWVFQMGGDGQASGVVYTDPQGTVFEMERVGDPISFK